MTNGIIKPSRRSDTKIWSELQASDIPDKSQVEAGIGANTPTATDIKSLYESNADTNPFTDAEQSKLSGIDTGATKTYLDKLGKWSNVTGNYFINDYVTYGGKIYKCLIANNFNAPKEPGVDTAYWFDMTDQVNNNDVNSSVRLNTGNGYGSTNTHIRRFTNDEVIAGTDITYVDSATNGAAFTINKDGLYSISYSDGFDAASPIGISRNSTELTTGIQSIASANKLIEASTGAAAAIENVSITIKLYAGDVIRPHANAIANSSESSRTSFTITRIGDLESSGNFTKSTSLLRAYRSTGYSVNATGLTVLYDQVQTDKHNAYNPATGKWTAPYDMEIEVSAKAQIGNSGGDIWVYIQVNDVSQDVMVLHNTAGLDTVMASITIFVAQGSTVSIFAKATTTQTFNGGSIIAWFQLDEKLAGDGSASEYQPLLAEGAFVDGDKTKLDGVDNRANHTGTQVAATISDFASAVASSHGLGNHTDVLLANLALDNILKWNGVSWVNGTGIAVSGSAGVDFYQATPILNAAGVENDNIVGSLSISPVVTAEQTIAKIANNNTVLLSAWMRSEAMNRTTLDAGIWGFSTYAAVNSVASGRISTITRQIYKAQTESGGVTISITGTGTSRTVTASGGTPFSTAKIDASATNTTASYIKTPKGLYQITARTSDTVVTIATPTGYINESAVAFTTWKKLFGSTTPTITATGTNYALLNHQSVQGSFTVLATDILASIAFFTSNNTTTVTTTYNGSSRNTRFVTPLVTKHNDMAGLQGGAEGDRYHITLSDVNKLAGIEAGATVSKKIALANYYVSTTGNDTTGTGSSGTPWATIQKALDYLQDYSISPTTGCKINVAAGTYSPSTTISVDHPDAQYLTIEGAGEASTFIESTATPCIKIEKYCRLKALSSMKFQRATYGGTQYVIYLDKFAEIGAIGNVDVDKMYSPLYLSNNAQAVVNSCDWSAYDVGMTVLFGAFLQIESGTFNGTGGAASPIGISVYEGKCRVFASCTISNNDIGMQALRDGTILDSGATMTSNTTDYSPTRSTGGTITYESTFGKILGI